MHTEPQAGVSRGDWQASRLAPPWLPPRPLLRFEDSLDNERRGHEIIVVKSKVVVRHVVHLVRGYTWCMTCLVLRSEMTQQADEAAVAGRLAAVSWAVESPVASGALAVSTVGRS